jgi:hypothetical protein
MPQPSLRPQDVVVLAKLLTYKHRRPPMAQIGGELSISSSEVHAALKRLVLSGLVSRDSDGHRPLLDAVEEFLVHGVKYAFPAKRGEVTRGLPTSYAAPPLKNHVVASPEWPPVWPFPEGSERGVGLEPLYKTVPLAASRDSELYEWLVLIDGLREGRSRERRFAAEEVARRLRQLR